MPELQLIQTVHAAAVLAFELANRAFFASVISDRGDAYFEHFDEQFAALVADQAAGAGAFYLLLDAGAVLGRFNLTFGIPGNAILGYRIAEHCCGRGVASSTVEEICRLAATQHGVRTMRAAVAHNNPASERVLIKASFIPVGPAESSDLGGKSGTWYERDLTAEPPPQGSPAHRSGIEKRRPHDRS